MNTKEFNKKQQEYKTFIDSLATQQTVLHKSRSDVYSFLSEGVLYEVHVETENYTKTRRESNSVPTVVGVWRVPDAVHRAERITEREVITEIANDLMYELYETKPYSEPDFGFERGAVDAEKEMRFLDDE
jgi:hypothetical protein